MTKKTEYKERDRFIQRELSWLAFNERVLEEAEDKKNPLLERLKFSAIFISNLNEFYAVRVAGIKGVLDTDVSRKGQFGYYPQEVLEEITQTVERLTQRFFDNYQNKLLKDLKKNFVEIHQYKDLNNEQKSFVDEYFESTVFPIITPMAVDPGHPFPALPSGTIAFVLLIEKAGVDHLAIVPIPRIVKRFLKLPRQRNEHSFILIDDIVKEHIKIFFKGYKIKDCSLFRLIRDSEISIEEDAPNLLHTIEAGVSKRTRAQLVFVAVEHEISEQLLNNLSGLLRYPKEEVVRVNSTLDLSCLFELYGSIDIKELKFPPYTPQYIEYDNIFEHISAEDMMLHMPFQSFSPTVDLFKTAANDPNVLAIKMTLYRASEDSAIVNALKDAASNGKQVTILIEIKARFDEKNNIKWVKELENAGCHVIYGMPGFKVHSKMAMIVRKEEGQIKRYVHLSTGNYNEKTAELYTDIGYFTCNDDFGRDISEVFNVVTGFSMPSTWQRVVSSPHDLRNYFYTLIEREMDNQKNYKNGRIWAKMNSLEDTDMINKLYEASQAGVKIQLIVRGICCLIPGVKGLSENIEVKSIVGRFLEHSRIFIFNHNDQPRYYLSSADWMRRNLDRRIELLFEIHKGKMKKHLQQLFDIYWSETSKSRLLSSDHIYKRVKSSKHVNAHEKLIDLYSKSS